MVGWLVSQSVDWLVGWLVNESVSQSHYYLPYCVQVVELVEYSASQCPRIQANIVCGWVGRILDDLLKTEASHPWIEQYVHGWLQSQLTEKLSALVEKASDKVRTNLSNRDTLGHREVS